MSTAIVYHWKLHPGREDDFTEAWREVTLAIYKPCGSQGSRLHRDEGGGYWAYACWPSEEKRKACFSEDSTLKVDQAIATMKECVATRFDETQLTIVSDLLGEKAKQKDIPVLETERLHLRPLEFADADALFPALSSEENMRYWSRGPIESVEKVREYIRWNVDGADVECFALTKLEATSDAMGWVILMHKGEGQAEVGYILRPDAQGQGFAREAGHALMRHALETRKLRRVFADVDPDNQGSIKLLENLGMSREGHLRATWETHIGVRDSYIYGRLASDSAPP
jgi:ribosomal-protein-alanine N-acetyltransferase